VVGQAALLSPEASAAVVESGINPKTLLGGLSRSKQHSSRTQNQNHPSRQQNNNH
jgi:hypothetical protein